MNQNKHIPHQPSENGLLFPAAFLRIRIPRFLLILAMVFITIGCDSIVDQNTEADTDITTSEMAGDLSVEEGSVIECIDPTVLAYHIVTDSKTVKWGNPRNPFEKKVEIEYYNTLTEFVIRVKSTQAIADVLVDNESIKDFDGTVDAGTWQKFAFDLDEDWEAGEKQTFSLKVAGSGPAAEFEVDYTLVGACWLDVYNPKTKKTWMDRNLGASRAAKEYNDSEAYGDLFQWGRLADGHQIIARFAGDGKTTSGTRNQQSTSPQPDHADFIRGFNDWLEVRDDDLWQGVDGINNPCPVGYRIPTMAEWQAERLSWSSNNREGAFNSPLKLTVAGIRVSNSGSLPGVGSYGGYWGSISAGSRLYISISSAFPNRVARADGYSVRCIKD